MNVMVTGGCGFIGSHLVRYLRRVRPEWRIVNYDLLTYSGNLENLGDLESDPSHVFVRGDVAVHEELSAALAQYEIEAVLHLAAESHVDRSIMDPAPFIRTNILGTQTLLELARTKRFGRLVIVSTDEVYGSLGDEGLFTEDSPLSPSSPYSASKASADLMALAYHRTFGTELVITRCSNNYGSHQFPEKLIPFMVLQAEKDQPLPIFGDGGQVRDWLHVEDHCRGILSALERGTPGRVYNLGGQAEHTNMEIVREILSILGKGEEQIRLVPDRPGQDRRYAMDISRAKAELGWEPTTPFEQGLVDVVRWYRDNPAWSARVTSGAYRSYYEAQYRGRLHP